MRCLEFSSDNIYFVFENSNLLTYKKRKERARLPCNGNHFSSYKELHVYLGLTNVLFLSLSPSLCQTDTFFSVMRLVIPQVDKSRAAYGLKETALAKQYIDILNIAKDSRDAKKLLNYRAPTAAQQVKGDSVWGNVTCF